MVTALTLEAIRQRKSAALNRRDQILAEIVIVDDEIAECDAAERLFARINNAETFKALDDLFLPAVDSEPIIPKVLPFPDTGPFRPKTNKHYIWQCLKNSQNRWLTAVEIRNIASLNKGEDIPMSSISPTLNAMMNDEYIVREGLKVALKERIESKNPATEAAGS